MPRKATPAEPPEPLAVHQRWMIRRDMPEVLEIEHALFENPWCEDTFIKTLQVRNCIGWVAEIKPPTWPAEEVIGFMVYELEKGGLRLLNLAVDPRAQRRDVGTQLVDKLKSKLRPGLREWIRCEVRETNLAAQCFFRSLGFRCTNVLREFYDDTDEDAYAMEFDVRGAGNRTGPTNRIARLGG